MKYTIAQLMAVMTFVGIGLTLILNPTVLLYLVLGWVLLSLLYGVESGSIEVFVSILFSPILVVGVILIWLGPDQQ